MTPDDIARDLQFREGFTLVDYAEVGLPVFRLTIEAVTTATRTLPTIQEFVMRCMDLGESAEDDIARMLGLKVEIVRGTVDALVLDGLVSRTAIAFGVSSFSLTAVGQERLAEDTREVVQEEMIVIDYDAMRRMPIRLAGENVVRASELRNYGAVEIRPYPSDPPHVGELPIPEIRRAIRRQSGDDFRRTLLALKRIVRRNNVFREAVALVFAADRGGEIQVAFAIDGKLSESHERAFAENGGPRKMGFLRSMEDDGGRKRLDKLLGREALSKVPPLLRINSLRREEALARAQVRSIEPAAEGSRGRLSRNPAVPALAVARERHAIATDELNALDLRPLACFEQEELLWEALTQARRSLLVTTAGLQPSILTVYQLREIDRLTRERGSVRIASFLAPQTQARGGDHFDPLAELSKMAQRSSLELICTPRSSFFFVIKDEDLAVISNRPFFGEMVRRSGFQRVVGYVTRDQEMVERIRVLANAASRPKKPRDE